MNRIEALGDAAAQVAGLYQIGFARTFLGVVVIVDGRENDRPNVLFRGTSDGTWQKVIDSGALDLPEKAGLIYVEIVQPLQSSIDDAATVSIGTIRPAIRREQSADLSNQIERFFCA